MKEVHRKLKELCIEECNEKRRETQGNIYAMKTHEEMREGTHSVTDKETLENLTLEGNSQGSHRGKQEKMHRRTHE